LIVAASLVMPFHDLEAAEEAGVLANRASAWKHRGDLRRAEQSARAAVARDPGVASARYALGVVLAASRREREAEEEYREALGTDPGHAAAAANLAVILVASGRSAEAIPVLRRALQVRPTDESCWTNLVIAYAASGDVPSARSAAAEASRSGVVLEWGLLEAIGTYEDGGGEQR
jgi:Flp pilus assembly protein TadD